MRSKIDYGSQIYAPSSNHILKRLDIVHNQAIRICTVAFKSSPVVSLYAESGDAPFAYRRQQFILQHYVRMKRLSSLPLFQVVLNTDDRKHYVNNMSKAPIGIRIQQLSADIGVNDFNIQSYQNSIEPPWKLPEHTILPKLNRTTMELTRSHL